MTSPQRRGSPRHNRRAVVLLACAAGLASLFVNAPVAAEGGAPTVVLQISGIRGDSRLAGFEGAIDCDAFSHEVQRSGSGLIASQPVATPLVVTKALDASTPLLLREAAAGRVLPSATLSVLLPDGQGRLAPLYTVRLESVSVTSVATGTDADGCLVEEVRLAFARISWTFYQADGRPVSASWMFDSAK